MPLGSSLIYCFEVGLVSKHGGPTQFGLLFYVLSPMIICQCAAQVHGGGRLIEPFDSFAQAGHMWPPVTCRGIPVSVNSALGVDGRVAYVP